jgi:tungstate transport system substrate-binding protein
MSRWVTGVLGLLAALGVLGAPCSGAQQVLVLATTTSTENSGLLGEIHPDFEKKSGIRVKVVAKGTGASLQLARDGNADVVLVHAPDEEERFVEKGYGVLRRPVMYNDFVIIGPEDDRAGVGSAKTPGEAFARVARARHVFVSRGDGSGTHLKEQELWLESGAALERHEVTVIIGGMERTFESVRPTGDWYLEIGQGMGKAITMTTEMRGYTLADRGTYYALALARPAGTDLRILYEGHESLRNPYSVIAVNPRRHAHVNFEGARRYIEWIASPEVQRMIGDYRVGGKVLFHPSAKPAGAQ